MTLPVKGFTDNPDHDQYTNPPMLTDSRGETVFDVTAEGTLEPRWKANSERPNSWKGARKILGCSDDKIHLVYQGANGKNRYTVLGVTVTFNPAHKGPRYNCLKGGCGIRGDCPHTRRLDRWRGENFA